MRYIVLDLEYSRNNHQRITEIGALKLEFNEVINKPKIISIFNSQFIQMKDYVEALNKFLTWLKIGNISYKLCCWGTEDKRILNKEYYRNKIETSWINNNYINLQKDYNKVVLKKYFGIKNKHSQLLENRIKIVSMIGLGNALTLEDIKFWGKPHHAFPDAYNMTKIFTKYFNDWDFVKKDINSNGSITLDRNNITEIGRDKNDR